MWLVDALPVQRVAGLPHPGPKIVYAGAGASKVRDKDGSAAAGSLPDLCPLFHP